MEKNELKEAVTEAVKTALGEHKCKCFLDPEGQQLVIDGVNGGKLFKKAIIIGLVLLVLGGLGLRWLKPLVKW